jgi:hypothetical protein
MSDSKQRLWLTIPLPTQELKDLFEKAAKLDDRPVASWARRRLVRMARQEVLRRKRQQINGAAERAAAR